MPYVYVVRGRVTGSFRARSDTSVCGGSATVRVRTRRGLVRKQASVNSTCAFQVTAKVPRRLVRRPTRLALVVRYAGSPNLLPATKRTRVRAG